LELRRFVSDGAAVAMDAQEKYGYWLDAVQYDLESAAAMLAGGRWLYVVFMCQQAIEKLVKGLCTLYVDDDVPRSHSIRTIIGRFEEGLPAKVPDEHSAFFDTLSAYYLNNRYPDYKNRLSTQMGEAEATAALSQTKDVFAWPLTLKP
jgi:HEPN domain-containing protein